MSKNFGKGLFTICTLALLAFSCIKVDNEVGKSFVPDSQKMKVAKDTVSLGISAYLSLEDSIPINYNFYGNIGSMKSESFGYTKASWLGQFTPTFISDDDAKFASIIDSLRIVFAVSAYYGDTTTVQTFNLHEVTRRFYYGTVYYSNLNLANAYDPEPLATIEYSGTGSITTALTGEKAEAFMKRLYDTPEDLMTNDSLFVDSFNGLCLIPADQSPRDASILMIDYSSSGFTFYTHDSDPVADTVTKKVHATYSFSNEAGYLTQFSIFDHDYAEATIDISRVNDTLPTSTPVSVGYIQGAAGITTYLRLNEDFVAQVQGLIVAPYTNILINAAYLEFGLNEPSIESLSDAFTRLGLYQNYGTIEGIADYDYTEEYNQYYDIKLPYDGYLNRTRNSYLVNISRYIQNIAMSSDPKSRHITLGPAYGFDLYSHGEVALNFSDAPGNPHPPRVIITYTLLKS